MCYEVAMSKLHLLENFALHYPKMRISRFSLKAGEKIPLHIHANQFGLVYLLKGKCDLSTYTVDKIDRKRFLLLLDSKQMLTEDSYSILTPKKNAHQIDIIDDSIFLDIFSPGSTKKTLSVFLDIIESEQNGTRLVTKKTLMNNIKLPASLKADADDFIQIT